MIDDNPRNVVLEDLDLNLDCPWEDEEPQPLVKSGKDEEDALQAKWREQVNKFKDEEDARQARVDGMARHV